MVLKQKEIQNIAVFGAIAGAVTPLLTKFLIVPVLNFFGGIVPSISAKLQEAGSAPAISINVRESLTGVDAWYADALGLTSAIDPTTFLGAAVAGALFFVAGAYIADSMKMLKGNAEAKTRNVILWGSLGPALLVGLTTQTLGISFIDGAIALAINAAILSFVYVRIDKQLGLNLIPFK